MKVHTLVHAGAVAGDVVPKSQPALSIPIAKCGSFRVRVGSSEGRIVAVYVKQKTGTPLAFGVELLTSAIPYPTGVAGAYNVSAAQDPGLFRAIPRQSATAGNAVEYFDDYGLSFINADQVSQTENNRFLNLVIIPTTSPGDVSTWEVRITTEHQSAGV